MIITDKWRIVSDDDMVLKAAIKKAFSNEFQEEKIHYFVNDFDKTVREDAYN